MELSQQTTILRQFKEEYNIPALALINKKGKLLVALTAKEENSEMIGKIPALAFSIFEENLEKFQSSRIKSIKVQGKENNILFYTIQEDKILIIWMNDTKISEDFLPKVESIVLQLSNS